MKIDVDLPKFDIPKDFIVGDGITGDILNMYGLFPCKIKAGVFAFCTRGTIRVTINLDEHTARDRKSTRLNSSHTRPSRMPSSA